MTSDILLSLPEKGIRIGGYFAKKSRYCNRSPWNKIVLIQDVIFKGKRSLEWADVEAYLKQFVGEVYTVEKTADLVYIGKDLPDEYTHSNYTVILKVQMQKQRLMQYRDYQK